MSKDKIIRIPISYDERQKNKHPEGYLPCEVSGRYIQFDLSGSNSHYVVANVMTEKYDGSKDRKLCELVFKAEDLAALLSKVNKIIR